MTERNFIGMDPDHPCTPLHDPMQKAFGIYQLSLGNLLNAINSGASSEVITSLKEEVESAEREHQLRSKAWKDCTKVHGDPDVRYN